LIRDGVAEMIARRLDPEHIRRRTLQAIDPHRVTFAGVVNRILADSGRTPHFSWGDGFTHKMYRLQDFALISREVARS
jgi:hypothetical protein